MIFPEIVRRIQNGLPVNEAIANMPHDDLEARTTYLKAVLEAFQAGRALTHQNAALSASTAVGTPVYWNETNSEYTPALATYTVTASGEVSAAASSRALGVVIEKTSSRLGTVALFGLVKDVDISAIVGASPTPGLYYVSGTTAGSLVPGKQPVSVPILYVSSATEFWVSPPNMTGAIEHQHYAFNLIAEPAGVTNDPTGTEHWQITVPDADMDGWLPAGHASFLGQAPSGAKFGYNISKDASLMSVWPPAPLESAKVLLDGVEMPMGSNGAVIVNTAGIWWMSDCVGQVPWDELMSFSGGSIVGSIPGYYGSSLCPDIYPRTVVLAFSRVTGDLTDAFVTHLEGIDPVQVVLCSDTTQEAAYGHLAIKLTELLTTTGSVQTDALVGLTRTRMTTGPHIAGIRATGSATAVGSNSFLSGGNTYQKGLVVLDVSSEVDSREGDVELIALNDVGESSYDDILFLLFPNGRESSIRGKIHVPTSNLPSPAKMKLQFLVLAIGAGDLPDFTLTRRILPEPTAGTPKRSWVTPDTAMADLAPAVGQDGLSAYQYVLLESELFTVAAGDLVFFTFLRSAVDGYASDVGLLKARWQITTG